MNYKKRYYKLKGKNKNLSDKIENLYKQAQIDIKNNKLEISSMKSTQSKSVDEINSLVNELEEIRLEFLSVIRDLEKCKELYTILPPKLILYAVDPVAVLANIPSPVKCSNKELSINTSIFKTLKSLALIVISFKDEKIYTFIKKYFR